MSILFYGRERGLPRAQSRTSQYRIRVWPSFNSYLFLLSGLLIGFLLASTIHSPLRSRHHVDTQTHTDVASHKTGQAAAHVLVLYSFAVTDNLSTDNLDFFVSNAIHADDGAEYVIIVNLKTDQVFGDLNLPALPRNAQYMTHTNECYDWGTYAWALDQLATSHLRPFTYFVFLNSSVRGPMLPAYARGTMHWTVPFTSKITKRVKLVGPAISCEKYCLHPDTCRQTPHVQSVAVATDHVGLKVLKTAKTVLKCHEDRDEAVYFGEVGASHAILKAGFNIDSFLTRYQDVDWNDPKNQHCNAETSPIGNNMMDGLTVSSFEAIFPKLKASLLETQMPSHVEAAKLSSWMTSPVEARHIDENWLLKEGRSLFAAEVLVAKTKGADCFDWDYYLDKYPDVAGTGWNREQMFRHFLAKGMLEYREHRWKCGLDYDAIIPTSP